MFPTFAASARTARVALLLGSLLVWVANPCSAQPESSSPRRDVAGILAITDGELAAAVERAVRGAARLLERPACATVLDEFGDATGRRLRDVLASLTLSPGAALSRMIFRDGREHATCRSGGIAAFTGPGSRVVFVCGNRFGAIGRERARQVIIHEMLHTLGLDERPPAPADIDRAVARRCAL